MIRPPANSASWTLKVQVKTGLTESQGWSRCSIRDTPKRPKFSPWIPRFVRDRAAWYRRNRFFSKPSGCVSQVFFEFFFQPTGVDLTLQIIDVIHDRPEKRDPCVDAFDLKQCQRLLRAGGGVRAVTAVHDQLSQQ